MVVREGKVVGRGFHRGPGTAHAEVVALEEAGELAHGADLYVTLEPCVHTGRTPPCVEAIQKAGIRRVVVGAVDPDPKVAGRGLESLKAVGIEVTLGLPQAEAEEVDPAYFHHRRTGRPFVRYKVAASIDGFVAALDGSSRWITCEEARRDAHALRAVSDAVLVGVGTVMADDPQLTCRLEGYEGEQPVRVVFDSRGSLTGRERVFTGSGKVLVATTSEGASRLCEHAKDVGIRCERFYYERPIATDLSSLPSVSVLVAEGSGPERVGDVAVPPVRRVDVLQALEFLGSCGVVEVLLEGGPTLAASFLEAGCIDEVVVYLGAKVLGGGRPVFVARGANSIEEASRWEIREVGRVGEDVKLVCRPRRSGVRGADTSR